MHHSEAESTLFVQRKVEAVDKFTFKSLSLKEWLNIDNLKVTVRNIELHQSLDQYSGSTSGLWQIEGSDFT